MAVEKMAAITIAVVIVILNNSCSRNLETSHFTGNGIRIARTTCEYRINPLGIDAIQPRLGWIIESDERNQKQTAYQILASTDPASSDMWDTGKVSSEQSVNVVYDGKPLKSYERLWWRVRVWDKNDRPSEYSEPAFWEMGMIAKEDWQAKWIGLNSEGKTKRPAPYLRKELTLAKPIKSARLYATALGLYEFYINGERVGKHHLTPGYTDYNKHVQYQTYDVTSQLKRGENAIGAILGDGWFAGYIGWSGQRGLYGKFPKLLAQLEIEFTDGSTRQVVTDQSWRVTRGPIREDDIYDGETYDARKELDGWDRPGYNDDDWDAAEVFEENHTLVAEPDEPVQVMQTVKPVSVKETEDGVFVFDLGQNMVGWVRLKVKGDAGTKVKLRHAEVLDDNGAIYTANLRRAKATDCYILKGKGEEIFEPHFTYHGFRYVEVTGYPGKPSLDAIEGHAAYSACPPSGTFECSNDMVNKLQSNIVWGMRGNHVSIPTDCPQRDERLGWMGDAQVFARTACFNMNMDAFYAKWMRDVNDGQTEDGSFCDVSPRILMNSDGAPAWGDAGVIVPWTVYQCYEDTRLLAKCYPFMKKWVDHIDKANPDHIWRKRVGNNYGDWVAPGENTSKAVISTAFFARSAWLVAQSAKALGKEEDAKNYGELFDAVKAAFNMVFVKNDGVVIGDTQTAYALALRFGLLDGERREKAAERLAEKVAKRGHLAVGFVGVSHLLPALTDIGRTDLACKLLLTETYPSWLYMVKNGATTIWERWDGITPQGEPQDPGMNSFNHYAFGSVGEWMYAVVGGIDLAQPGYKKIIIKPQPGGGLTFAKCQLDSPYGKIATDWKSNGRKFFLKVTVPVNTTATVYLPDKSKPQEIGSGVWEFESKID